MSSSRKILVFNTDRESWAFRKRKLRVRSFEVPRRFEPGVVPEVFVVEGLRAGFRSERERTAKQGIYTLHNVCGIEMQVKQKTRA